LVGSGLNVVQESKSRKAEIAPTILNPFEKPILGKKLAKKYF
jgi:hypothetical protein